MNYYVQCNICKTSNALFEVKCTKCGSFLRERIFNIDLWSTFSLLIERPVQSFHNIIKSEHKNFLSLILILIFIKYLTDAYFILVYFLKGQMFSGYFLRDYGIVLAISLIILILESIYLRNVVFTKVKTRLKDIFSILAYSQIPHFFAALILFPIELIILGENLFSTNPAPYLLKPAITYFLSAFEILVVLWGFLLSVFAVYSISGKKSVSVINGILMNLIILSGILLSSFIIKQLNG